MRLKCCNVKVPSFTYSANLTDIYCPEFPRHPYRKVDRNINILLVQLVLKGQLTTAYFRYQMVLKSEYDHELYEEINLKCFLFCFWNIKAAKYSIRDGCYYLSIYRVVELCNPNNENN